MRTLIPVLILASAFAGDWPDYRGPRRDGTSTEKNLPAQWSPSGENLAWKAPYGGRSTPVIVGDRLYLFNAAGKGDTLQERLVCLHADTGKLLWEHKYNVYLSDVPPHRIAWSSPAADPANGNVYIYGVGGSLKALTRDGKLIWERSIGEEFGLVTTHGGRTISPIIEGDLVVISGITTGWGDQARAAHRFMAFDKKTGECVWVSSPGGRPFDTVYSPPVVADVNGMRLYIAGGADGAVHAMKLWTGEAVWKYLISKRGLNTGAVVYNNNAYVSHSEENYDTSEMGLVAAIDATAKGDIGPGQVKWALKGYQVGFSNPVMDGDRLYQVDNSSNLFAFDAVSGRQLWKKNLGTIQKASPVLADGKLYVGNENGRVFIVKPGSEGAEILDQDQLGTAAAPETITASPAVSNGRIYVTSMEATYCIGKKNVSAAPAVSTPAGGTAGTPAHLQVTPAELLLKPGDAVQFHARLYDESGRFVREASAQWESGLGTFSGSQFTAGQTAGAAGMVKATAEGLSGTARIRVIPAGAQSQNFDALKPGPPPPHWINTTGKYAVRELEGNNVLVKLADNAFTKRARSFFGQTHAHDYTVQADVRATERRRQMGDAGVVAQRYQLTLYGNHQRIELEPWQPETERTAQVNFAWKADTWYRLKLRVENLPDGKVRARGKAWPASEPEPAAWTIERIDPIPNKEGSPGLYGDAPFEVFFDNIKVEPNQ